MVLFTRSSIHTYILPNFHTYSHTAFRPRPLLHLFVQSIPGILTSSTASQTLHAYNTRHKILLPFRADQFC